MQIYFLLAMGLCCAGLISLLLGHGNLSDPELAPIFLKLRAARLGAAGLAGSALAVAGVIVQGLFRNPLADPSILGTTAGASLGGNLAMLSFEAFAGGALASYVAPELLLPLGSTAGAIGALGLLMLVQRSGDDLLLVLLTGFLLGSLFASTAALVISLAQERFELARAMISFALGDLAGSGGPRLLLALPLVAAGIVAAWLWSEPVDLLLSGEDEAAALGVAVRDVRQSCIIWTALLTAAAVSLGGSLNFVGLIVPHAMRPLVGAAHRQLIPAAALAGALFVVLCDILARVLPTRTEMPLGVVTGLIGAPLFLSLLIRSRRELTHA